MTKILSVTVSLAVALLAFGAASTPSQAATRLMSSSPDAFEYRCEYHGGLYDISGSSAVCQTPTVPVQCDYFSASQAVCAWPGIENQIAVIRVIGTLPAGYVASSFNSENDLSKGNGGGNGGGQGGNGFQGPDDFQAAPDNDPKPNFDGPKDFQMAP